MGHTAPKGGTHYPDTRKRDSHIHKGHTTVLMPCGALAVVMIVMNSST